MSVKNTKKNVTTEKTETPIVRKQTKRRHWIGHFLLLVALIVINSGVWSYLCYSIRVMCDEQEYTQRAKQQRLMEILMKRQNKKKVSLDAVAVVNGEAIEMAEIREMIETTPQLQELPLEEIYPNLLEMLINNRVVMQGAKKTGVLDRPEVKRQLRLVTEQIVGQTYLDELLKAHVSEEELQQVYQNEVKNFRREEEIRARHILLKTEKEAQDVLIQLKAGADFAALADKKSLDENTQGGDLGYFTKAMMIPEFGDAVFDLKKGQISDPIKTAFGWHIVLVEDKRLANPPAFEDVREDIEQAVMETKLKQVLDEERSKMNVQILRPTM